MTLLLNVNVPRSLCQLLSIQGHECSHAADLGLRSATDETVVDTARRMGATIITHDLDYGKILYFSGLTSPSVIILRLRDVSVEHVGTILRRVLSRLQKELRAGAIVTVEEGTVRVRSLK